MRIRFTNWKQFRSRGSGVSLRFIAIAILLFAPLGARAQNYSGSISGTVTDPSGAAVVGASVTVINPAINAQYSATTTELGAFSFAQLAVGTYEVHIKQASFKEYVAKSVEVHVSSTTEVNARLELGSANEMITVEASDVQVQTTSAVVGEVVEGQQVRELPLNGRNFIQLTQLQPGVSAANSFDSKDKGLQGGADFSVNGNPNTNNLFLIDGVNNNDVGSNRTILIYPSVDAIAEFKMLRNSYGPEYGQASGAIISITTRSGENQFHGGVFYEGRNDKLDAAGFFANRNNTGKPPLRRNDWGYYIGGPIKKDKLFFWWNEEWNRDIRAFSVANCMPTAAERAGDFSADVTSAIASLNSGGSATANTTCNAPPPATFTNTGTTGNPNFVAASGIPVASQASGNAFAIASPDAVGQLLAAYYPLPNRSTLIPGTNYNWASNQGGKVPWREENVRIDYDITKKHRATFRYTQDAWSFPAPNNAFGWGDTNFATFQGSWNQPSKSIMGRLTSTISNSLLNDLEFGYAHNAIILAPGGTNPGLGKQFDAAMPPVWPSAGKIPGGIPTVWGGLQNYGNFASIWAIVGYGNHMDLYTLQDNVSKVRGSHIWKFGGLFSSNIKEENQFGGSDRPTFGISNNGWGQTIVTGNALANVLLPGTGANPQMIQGVSETNVNPTDHGRWHDIEFYAGDTWKVSRRVTVNYGLRWSLLREPYNANNQMASFSLAAYNPNGNPADACNGVIVVPGTNFCSAAATATGLPLSSGTPGVNRALVNNNNHAIAPRLGIAWDIWGTGKTALRVGVGQFFQRERVSPQVGLSDTAPFAITASLNRSLDTAVPLAGASTSPNDGRSSRGVVPNTWQWNISVEQQLARNTTLQVGYVGNVGIHLTSSYDINQVPESGFGLGAFLGSSSTTTTIGSTTYTTPGINSLRPAANFGAINFFSRDGHSTYHSLQALFRSKLSNFSTFQAAYTWSHTIADIEGDNSSGGASQGSFTDIQNRRADRGNTTINRPQIFVLSEVFFLPKLNKGSELVHRTLGEWELNTIFTAEQGNSISIFQNGVSENGALISPTASKLNCTDSNGNSFPCALQSLTGSGYGNNQRPNIVPGTSCNSGTSGLQVFNPAAFTVVGYQLGTVGNAPRGACHGPSLVNADIELSKNWTLREKFRIRFSMDFFNAFNHVNFDAGTINTAFVNGSVNCGPADASGFYQRCGTTNNVVSSASTVNNFGQATATRPARELQYGLKITF